MLERQMERQRVVAALSQLEEGSREIVVLRFYNDLKLEDIAQIVQLPLNTVKTRLYRGLKQLKQIMDGEVQVSAKKSGRV